MRKFESLVIRSCFFICFAIILSGGPINGQSINGQLNGADNVNQWAEQHFAKGKIPHFRFVLGGKSSDNFIKTWQFSSEKQKSTEPDAEVTVYSYSDKKSGLVVKCKVTCFNDFHAVEWVLKFSNTSSSNTPVIEKWLQLIIRLIPEVKELFVLHHAKGSNAERSDFQPIDENMQIGKSTYMTPVGGRSSDNTAFPFFNIEMPGHTGIMVAVNSFGSGNFILNTLLIRENFRYSSGNRASFG